MQQHIADDDIVISFDGFGGVSVNEAYFCSRCFSRQFSRMSGRMSTMVYEPSMPRPEYAFLFVRRVLLRFGVYANEERFPFYFFGQKAVVSQS